MTPEQLEIVIRGCQEGKSSSQQQLYKRYAGRMLAVCLRYLPSKPEAEDVFQEAFVKVFANINKFEVGRTNFDFWIRRIFINESINHYHRVRRKHYWQEDIDEFRGSFEEGPEIFSSFGVEEIEKLIETLPEGAKVVFNLFAIEGYAHNEIATMLGISEGTSRSQLNRAREILKSKIQKLSKTYDI